MVYNGKPSQGCENCRKAKKRCDQEMPCSRCARLSLTCGGYRDVSQLVSDMDASSSTSADQTLSTMQIFHDESQSIARRVGGASSTQTPLPSKPLATDPDEVARSTFFNQVVTESYLSFMQHLTPDEFLLRPILACGFSLVANRAQDPVQGRELATQYYVDAIEATNEALRHPRKVKEDNTILAVFLLGVYERINHEGPKSAEAWTQHIKGTSMCLQLRGRSQLRTKAGAALFRDLRTDIVVNCLMMESSVPEYIVQWSQSLEYDPIQSPCDQLMIIAARVAKMREAYLAESIPDQELLTTAKKLDEHFVEWSQRSLAEGSTSFHNVEDPNSVHAWSGVRHEYGMPQGYRHWNLFRCMRIVLSRTQEALWRRSWPTLVNPRQEMPSPQSYRDIRNRMVEDICVAAAYAFGDDNEALPPTGAVSSALLLLNPLALAATHLLERLAPAVTGPEGGKLMILDRPHHLDPDNSTAVQLAWVIDRIDYIAYKIGLQWAVTLSQFLKGETTIRYHIERSRAVGRDLFQDRSDQLLDLSAIFRGTEDQ